LTCSENREIHQTIPDHRVKLTPEGWSQAYDAGRRLRKMLRPDDTLHFFTSPYRRTRETTEGILTTLTDATDDGDEGPSPFKRDHIKVYEEPRLREQDFGNFQPCSAAMERMWQERADYGHFFYRIPNGESAADAYDRVSGFNESLWRQFTEPGFASVCVLVTHGLMSRVFLMKWYHFTVEHFEDLRNINHCEFLIMRRDDGKEKYVLENQLRTWSALRQERQREKDKEKELLKAREIVKLDTNGTDKTEVTVDCEASVVSVASPSPVEPRRKWGGCPNGCNHDKSFKIRKALADLIKCDNAECNDQLSAITEEEVATKTNGNGTAGTNGPSTSLASRRPAARRFLSSHSIHDGPNEESDNVMEKDGPAGGELDLRRAREEVVSSPDATPSYISVDDRLRITVSPSNPTNRFLHVGRDGGGTYSGHNSVVVSDADSSEDERHRRRLARLRLGNDASNSTERSDKRSVSRSKANMSLSAPETALPANDASPTVRHKREPSGMGRGTKADKLGDTHSSSESEQHSSEGEHDADIDDDITKQEKEESSVLQSVF
jgi:broad specificity phosphatase PhoE